MLEAVAFSLLGRAPASHAGIPGLRPSRWDGADPGGLHMYECITFQDVSQMHTKIYALVQWFAKKRHGINVWYHYLITLESKLGIEKESESISRIGIEIEIDKIQTIPNPNDELTKSWHAPYSSCIRPSTSATLSSVDDAEEKGYEHLPSLDEYVAAHLCPPTAIGWKGRATHPSFKPRCSPTRMPVWILPHSGTWEVQWTWLCEPPKLQPKRLDALCPASSCWSATSGSRWQRWKRQIKFPSSTLRSRQAACLDQLWSASLNVSWRLRSRLKRCDTSSPNAPAFLLLPVAPNLRRLSRQPNQRQPPRSTDLRRRGEMECAHARPDATTSLSAKDPGPRLPWIQCLRSLPDQRGRRRRGPSLSTAGPPRKRPLRCL